MKHLRLELQKLEERIAPCGVSGTGGSHDSGGGHHSGGSHGSKAGSHGTKG